MIAKLIAEALWVKNPLAESDIIQGDCQAMDIVREDIALRMQPPADDWIIRSHFRSCTSERIFNFYIKHQASSYVRVISLCQQISDCFGAAR